MSRTKRFLQGVGASYLSQAITVLVSLWLTPFFLTHLGKEQYGLWLVGLGILTYLMLLDLGVMALLPREIAYSTGQAGSFENAEEPSLVLSRTIQIILLQTPIIAIIALLVWIFLPPSWQSLHEPLGLVFVVFVLTYPLRTFQNVLQGLQDLGFLGLLFTVSWLAGSAISIFLVLSGFGLNSLAIGWGATQCILLLGSLFRLKFRFKSFSVIRVSKFSFRGIAGYLKKSMWMSISQLSQVLLNGTEVILIGKFLGPSAVVMYVCSSKLVSLLSNQAAVITQAAAPALSEMRASESRERLLQASAALNQLVVAISGAIVCLVLAINEGFVKLWVGPELFGGMWLTVLILINMFIRHWEVALLYNVFCFGHERSLALTGILDGVLSISVMFYLIPQIGLIAVPAAGLLSVILVALPVMLMVLARELNVTVIQLIQSIFPWFVQIFMLGIVLCFVVTVWVPHSIPGLAVLGVGALLVYVLTAAPFVMKSALGEYLLPRLALLKSKFSTLMKTL